MDEEEKIEEAEAEVEKVEEVIDDDFADAVKPVAESVVEEQEEEPEPEPEPEKEPEPEEIVYSDDRLKAVEDARLLWNKTYRKTNSIKTAISFSAIALIILGYIIPYFALAGQEESARSTWTLVICGITAVIGIGAIAAYGFYARKKNRETISKYFNAYYSNVNAYAFDGLDIRNLSGNADAKIEKAEVDACGLYPNSQVGSRDNLTFTYKDLDCALCDMAAQKDMGKALTTVFVGKYLRAHNHRTISSDGLVIYFKGNARALPPTVTLPVYEDNKKFVVYGSKEDARILTHDIRDAFRNIRTDSLLVDVAIAIKPGRTFIAMGYEDDLMILPNDKPFNPKYVEEYAKQVRQFLELAVLLDGENSK